MSASDIYKFQPRRPVAPPRGTRAARARPGRSVPAPPRRQRGRSVAQHAAAVAAHAALVAAAAAAADDDDEDEEEDDPDDEAPLTELQVLARLVGDEPWPSEGGFLGPYADLRLFLGDAVLAEDRWDSAKQVMFGDSARARDPPSAPEPTRPLDPALARLLARLAGAANDVSDEERLNLSTLLPLLRVHCRAWDYATPTPPPTPTGPARSDVPTCTIMGCCRPSRVRYVDRLSQTSSMICYLYYCYDAQNERGDKVHSSECNALWPMADNDEADAQHQFTFGDSARAHHTSPAPGPPLPPPATMPPPAADVTQNATARPHSDPHGNSVRIGEAHVPAPSAGAGAPREGGEALRPPCRSRRPDSNQGWIQTNHHPARLTYPLVILLLGAARSPDSHRNNLLEDRREHDPQPHYQMSNYHTASLGFNTITAAWWWCPPKKTWRARTHAATATVFCLRVGASTVKLRSAFGPEI